MSAPRPACGFDFRTTARVLRDLLAAHPPYSENPDATAVALSALKTYEREQAVQCYLYLYEHLLQFEQFREAATLLAFALSHHVRTDPRIKEAVGHLRSIAENASDPGVEQAYNYLGLLHAVDFNAMLYPQAMPPRCAYFLSVARLARAKTAMEFGTGCGTNIYHCALVEPNIRWIGADVSAEQIAYLKKIRPDVEAKAGLALPLQLATFDELEREDIRADAVAVLDVLEHTLFPDELLGRAERACAPGGIVCITTPNSAWSVWSKNVTGAVVGSHVAVESLPTLVARIEARGGNILDARILPGSIEEGNSNVAVAYEPRRSPQ